jgi:hypothetical protein
MRFRAVFVAPLEHVWNTKHALAETATRAASRRPEINSRRGVESSTARIGSVEALGVPASRCLDHQRLRFGRIAVIHDHTST